jgi:uncharacterized membrane protein YkvA (DUF1232 family)
MSLRVTFDLEEKDLKFFRNQMKRAQETAARTTEAEIIARAEAMVTEVAKAEVPLFVAQRIEKLSALIEMLKDQEWALQAQERKNVTTALAYFADPHDLIPDSVPVIGYIDDAIMIELVVKELSHEIDAFADFCRYRKEEASRNRNPNITRPEYLEMKRRELHARMRRRRRSGAGRASGNTRTHFRLF